MTKVYTGFSKIDEELGAIKDGELVVVSVSSFSSASESFMQNLLYHLAKQTDERNRKNLPDYDETISCQMVFEMGNLEAVLSIGKFGMEFNVSGNMFNFGILNDKLERINHLFSLFENLPLDYMANSFNKNTKVQQIIDEIKLNNLFQYKITALCIDGRVSLATAKELAQQLKIPVIVFKDSNNFYKEELFDKKNISERCLIDKVIHLENISTSQIRFRFFKTNNCCNKEIIDFIERNSNSSANEVEIIADYIGAGDVVFFGNNSYEISQQQFRKQFVITLNGYACKANGYDDYLYDKVRTQWELSHEQEIIFFREWAKFERNADYGYFIDFYELCRQQNICCIASDFIREYPFLANMMGLTYHLLKEIEIVDFGYRDIILATDKDEDELRALFPTYMVKSIKEIDNPYAFSLLQMMQNPSFITKDNFSAYLSLSEDKNKLFWAYLTVFQTVNLKDLCQLIKEYKNDVEEKELIWAAKILQQIVKDAQRNIETLSFEI